MTKDEWIDKAVERFNNFAMGQPVARKAAASYLLDWWHDNFPPELLPKHPAVELLELCKEVSCGSAGFPTKYYNVRFKYDWSEAKIVYSHRETQCREWEPEKQTEWMRVSEAKKWLEKQLMPSKKDEALRIVTAIENSTCGLDGKMETIREALELIPEDE